MGYYYTSDHLGSTREVCSSTGATVARYSYDPYGRTTLVSGTNLATRQYANYYVHQTSGLNLTWGRAYDPNTGRWLSRDPLRGAELSQGPNLYEYVENSPFDLPDPFGLGSNGAATAAKLSAEKHCHVDDPLSPVVPIIIVEIISGPAAPGIASTIVANPARTVLVTFLGTVIIEIFSPPEPDPTIPISNPPEHTNGDIYPVPPMPKQPDAPEIE